MKALERLGEGGQFALLFARGTVRRREVFERCALLFDAKGKVARNLVELAAHNRLAGCVIWPCGRHSVTSSLHLQL